jgi:hypothetical protein
MNSTCGDVGFRCAESRSLYAARKPVRAAALPKEVAGAVPGDIVLYGSDGPVCRARSGRTFLLRRFVQPDEWDEGEFVRPPARDVASLIWNGASRTLLVAEVVAPSGDCAKALWARAASRSEPTIFVSRTAAPELAERVIHSVRALRGYKDNQSNYALGVKERRARGDEGALPARWEDVDDTKPEISTWQHGDRTLVSYSIIVGQCSELGGAMWALFEVRGPTLELLAESGRSTLTQDFRFDAVVDIDLDGRVEVFGDHHTLYDDEQDSAARSGPNGILFITRVGTAFHGCGC